MSKITSLNSKKHQSTRAGNQARRKTGEGISSFIPSRERYIQNFIAKHKLTIPPIEELFAEQIKRGWKKVPISKLAIFCKAKSWMNTKGGIGKALDDIAAEQSDDNYLNLSAEIDPKQVEKVIKDILEYGRLIHGVKVTSVTGVPETISHDPHVLQVWDGRHRTAALAIIYGMGADIPVDVSEMSYVEALNACVFSNDTRPLRKLELVHFQGLKDGSDAAAAYAKKDGNLPMITKFVVAHSLNQVPDPILVPVADVRVCEKLSGKKGITAVNFTNVVKEALKVLSNNFNNYALDKETTVVFNTVTDVFATTWLAIDRRSNGAKASTAWNAYSSIVLGRVIGRAINYWITSKTRITKDLINEFADRTATVAIAFMDSQAELYARTPHGTLESKMLDFGDKKLDIILPRVTSSIFRDGDEEEAQTLVSTFA